jgi:hypothetical protein
MLSGDCRRSTHAGFDCGRYEVSRGWPQRNRGTEKGQILITGDGPRGLWQATMVNHFQIHAQLILNIYTSKARLEVDRMSVDFTGALILMYARRHHCLEIEEIIRTTAAVKCRT